MSGRSLAGALFALLTLAGCTEAPVSLPLRSLERSGDVAFVCRGADGSGRNIDACPDFESEQTPHRLYALVTQTLRGEVAVVDLSAGSVLDLDRSTPGFDFLPIGGNPVDIVSSPTGEATFVGVSEVGKEGIFALPTTCIEPPTPDLTTWPACALPVAPGDMAIVVDPQNRAGCEDAPGSGADGGIPGDECPAAQLAQRYKLVVSLPELGGYVILDAQKLLEQPPGSFDSCEVVADRWVQLEVSLPAGDVPQDVPPDLEAPGCVPPELEYGPIEDTFVSQPGGLALHDTTLYVADRGAPVVHVLDLSDPCAPQELPPLLPKSFESPGRVVTTSRVAVSPKTTQGERFLYAIDELEGSVMAFDVGPGATQRTPIVRPGSARLPFEPVDRIAFASPARDLTFALRDVPVVDPNTGVATIGTYCDPVGPPAQAGIGAQYRPSADFTRGASPRELRGVFGFIALASGQVAVIDVEDFDAPCRRPITSNSASTEDFRGCAGDPEFPEYYTENFTPDGPRTVSGEASCNVVQRHRARSANLVITSPELGVRAPALRGFPQLEAVAGGTLPTGPTDEGQLQPKLLAVSFENPEGGTTPAQVFVGSTLYSTESAQNELVTDPAAAERPSVALLFNQPRSFAPEEDFTLTFEGALIDTRSTGLFDAGASQLNDADANFCSRGVQDAALARELGAELGVAADQLDGFARRHADYVQIVSELRDKDDAYWDGATCGGAKGNAAFFACRNQLGTVETPAERRDLRILEAYQGRLVVEPRSYGSEAEKQEIIELLHCCFASGEALKYQVRGAEQWILVGSGSGFRHNVTANASQDFRCVPDCSPRRSLLRSRALEISSSACALPKEGEPPSECAIGPQRPGEVACVIPTQSPVTPGGPGSECIFENLTHRFAIYRGNQPSVRDTRFTWQVTGGFSALSANLTAQTAAVSPQSLQFVPQLGQLAVVDGAAEGLVLVSLDSVAVSRLFF